MKTKLLTIAMTAALMFTAMTKVQAQNFDGPCLPPAHGLVDHQSAFCSIMQAIALSAGPNWFSTYVDITLDDLKAALVSEAPSNSTITIKSATQNIVYSRGRWNGTLDWDVAKMYIIIVPTDCQISLEGMLLNPAEHPITIAGNGSPTWIGFPFSNTMTVTDAFDGFAVNNDIIKSSNSNSQYSRGRWNGSVTNLEPGHGYIYVSAPGSADRVLIYQSSKK